MLEVAQDVWRYVTQMIPLGLSALVILMLLRPMRKKRLSQLNLVSSAWRETALVLFVVFCAGLAALTLFPANIWSYVISFGQGWNDGVSFFSFYPSWEETASQFAYLPNMLTPFEEISRALNRRSYWLLFMLLGNIIMFMPLGFFPALLWRRWKCFHNSSPGDGGDHTGNRSRGSDNSRYSHRGGRTGSCRQCRLF